MNNRAGHTPTAARRQAHGIEKRMGQEGRRRRLLAIHRGDGLEAAFCLSRKQESDEDSIRRRALAARLAEQTSQTATLIISKK